MSQRCKDCLGLITIKVFDAKRLKIIKHCYCTEKRNDYCLMMSEAESNKFNSCKSFMKCGYLWKETK